MSMRVEGGGAPQRVRSCDGDQALDATPASAPPSQQYERAIDDLERLHAVVDPIAGAPALPGAEPTPDAMARLYSADAFPANFGITAEDDWETPMT
jgi:hypothetical protein